MDDILIDTDVVIEYLGSRVKSSSTLMRLLDQCDVFLSSVSEFELLLGARTDRHIQDLEMLFTEIEVLPFDFAHKPALSSRELPLNQRRN